MLVAHHGTHHADLPRHPGLCLAAGGSDDGYRAASEYARVRNGEYVFEIALDLAGLVVEEVEVDLRECRDTDCWPADTARERAALLARGVDVIAYDDACHTLAHRTYRLISERALAALTVTGVYDPA